MAKDIFYGEDARRKLQAGVDGIEVIYDRGVDVGHLVEGKGVALLVGLVVNIRNRTVEVYHLLRRIVEDQQTDSFHFGNRVDHGVVDHVGNVVLDAEECTIRAIAIVLVVGIGRVEQTAATMREVVRHHHIAGVVVDRDVVNILVLVRTRGLTIFTTTQVVLGCLHLSKVLLQIGHSIVEALLRNHFPIVDAIGFTSVHDRIQIGLTAGKGIGRHIEIQTRVQARSSEHGTKCR